MRWQGISPFSLGLHLRPSIPEERIGPFELGERALTAVLSFYYRRGVHFARFSISLCLSQQDIIEGLARAFYFVAYFKRYVHFIPLGDF